MTRQERNAIFAAMTPEQKMKVEQIVKARIDRCNHAHARKMQKLEEERKAKAAKLQLVAGAGAEYKTNQQDISEAASLKCEVEQLRQELASVTAERDALAVELDEIEGEHKEEDEDDLDAAYGDWQAEMLGG